MEPLIQEVAPDLKDSGLTRAKQVIDFMRSIGITAVSRNDGTVDLLCQGGQSLRSLPMSRREARQLITAKARPVLGDIGRPDVEDVIALMVEEASTRPTVVMMEADSWAPIEACPILSLVADYIYAVKALELQPIEFCKRLKDWVSTYRPGVIPSNKLLPANAVSRRINSQQEALKAVGIHFSRTNNGSRDGICD